MTKNQFFLLKKLYFWEASLEIEIYFTILFLFVFEEKLKKSLKLLFLLEPLAGTIMCGLYVQLCMT